MSLLIDILAWIVFGAIAGWAAARIMNVHSSFFGNVWLGIIGSVVGNLILTLLGGQAARFSIFSLFVAVVGACIVVSFANRMNHSNKVRTHSAVQAHSAKHGEE